MIFLLYGRYAMQVSAMTHTDILYIEDNPADAELFAGLISQASGGSMQIICTPRLGDACKMLDVRTFAAVLVDLNLQEVTGAQPVALLRKQYPDLPVIALTGMDDDRLADEIVGLGAQDYIVKGSSDGHGMRRRIQHSILRQEYENRLFFSANYDEVTGLPKYQLFMEHLRHAIARARREEEMIAVMLLDIDGFYALGLEYGQEASDRAMHELAARLCETVRDCDIVARYGADQLVLLVENLQNGHRECLQVAGKIQRMLELPFSPAPEQWITLSLGMGIATYPGAGNDAGGLLSAARYSLNLAKKRGPGSVDVYIPGTETHEQTQKH